MKGQNDIWPWYEAAAGSLVHELIGSALLEIRNHDVRSVYNPLQPPDFAYDSMSIDGLCPLPLILHDTSLDPPSVLIDRRRMNEILGEGESAL